jgi:hypothetical protein
MARRWGVRRRPAAFRAANMGSSIGFSNKLLSPRKRAVVYNDSKLGIIIKENDEEGK